MKDYAEEIRKQMLELWGKTVGQLEEISRTLMSTTGLEKLKFDHARLVEERDKLIRRLGEEIYRLLEVGSLKVPAPAQDIYDRLRKVVERLLAKKGDITRKAAGAKKTAKKAKKSVQKTAKKVKKANKTAKKARKPAKKAKK